MSGAPFYNTLANPLGLHPGPNVEANVYARAAVAANLIVYFDRAASDGAVTAGDDLGSATNPWSNVLVAGTSQNNGEIMMVSKAAIADNAQGVVHAGLVDILSGGVITAGDHLTAGAAGVVAVAATGQSFHGIALTTVAGAAIVRCLWFPFAIGTVQ